VTVSLWGALVGGAVGTILLTSGLRIAQELGVTRMDIPLLLGLFGIWFAVFVAMLRRRPLVARVEMDEEEAAEAELRASHGHSHGGPASANPVA
jgi:hypothetical protein